MVAVSAVRGVVLKVLLLSATARLAGGTSRPMVTSVDGGWHLPSTNVLAVGPIQAAMHGLVSKV